MEISLELKNYCIKTGMKKQYDKLVNACLELYAESQSVEENEDEKERLEKEMEFLAFLLKNGDFNLLRSKFPELSQGPIKVMI